MTVTKLAFENFKDFREFPEDILSEIVREGERKLDAQLSTANAVDQRALAVLGFQITLAIAVLGGLASFVSQPKFDRVLVSLGLLVLVGLACAAGFAYLSVLPKLFRYPGNRPDSWFVEDWHLPPNSRKASKLSLARSEQCYCLYSAIYDNSEIMDDNAKLLRTSMEVMVITILFSSICFASYMSFVLLR